MHATSTDFARGKQMEFESTIFVYLLEGHLVWNPPTSSQRSLHNEPIFRLLLKVAVKGTQQCEFLNFCGVYSPITHWTCKLSIGISVEHIPLQIEKWNF
tara:strand:- start:129 stop:425 length:297 start_codon:yes stop_codon:yes gene_type:complete